MLWRYVLLGSGLLLLLYLFYPAIGSESTIIVIYTIGVAVFLYGLFSSAPVREPPQVLPSKKQSTPPEGIAGHAGNPWFPVFLIGGACMVLFVIGMLVMGIFIMAIENTPETSARAYESDNPEVMFINSDTGETRWLLRTGDQVTISDTRSLLISPEAFHEQRGRTGITITPVFPLHVITTGFRDDTFWIETMQNEDEDLRFTYSIDPGNRIPCTPRENGNDLVCGNSPPGGPAGELRENQDGGLTIFVNETEIGRVGPPAFSDARGEYHQFSYRVDPETRTISITGSAGNPEYPLYWTLPI